jgi:hypothetical protein
MPQVSSSSVTTNYQRVKTGSQLGTPELQALLIKTDNLNWGALSTDTNTGNFNIRISNPDTNFAKIVRAVQDYAEIYFIGNPQSNAGGETNKTECVIWVNVNTNTSAGELRSAGQWTDLSDHIYDTLGGGTNVWVYFAVQDGWIFRVDDFIPVQGAYGNGFPVIPT